MHLVARRPVLLCRLSLGLLAVSCGTGWAIGCAASEPPVTAVVVGVVTDLRAGIDFDELDVETKVNGRTTKTSAFTKAKLTFPLEVRLDNLAGGDAVEAKLSAKANGLLVVDRDARTQAVAGRTLLFRAPLAASCAIPNGPMCVESQTCAGGKCVDSYVDPKQLPEFSSGWAKGSTQDICKPGTGAPEVLVGEGQADYLPLDELQVVQVEAGPQGGFHVWLATRMKGLHQSGSVTTISGSLPALGYDVAASSVIFTFDPDEGGYCKIYGLRFRLDDDQHPVESLLGKELDVKIEIGDGDGDVGIGTRKLRLSSAIK